MSINKLSLSTFHVVLHLFQSLSIFQLLLFGSFSGVLQLGAKTDFLRLYIVDLLPQGLQHLRKLKNLQELNLSSTKITDVGLKELKQLEKLHILGLAETRITDAGLRDLKELNNLKELYVANSRVTDAGVEELKAARPELRIQR